MMALKCARHFIALVLLWLACLSPVQARLVEAQGQAVIAQDDAGSAREQAIQDAVRQSVLQASITVRSSSTVKDNALVEDISSIDSSAVARDVTILSEWRDERYYYVRIRAQIIEPGVAIPGEKRKVYRKKLAGLQFNVLDRRQINDFPGIERELSREIVRRIENTNRVLVMDGGSYLIADSGQVLLDGKTLSINEAVARIAKALGVQFLVLGTVRDMGIQNQSVFSALRRWSFSRYDWQSGRRLELDVSLYDGITGTLISRRRASEWVAGAGQVGTQQGRGSAAWLTSEYGRVMDRVIDQLSEGLALDLDRLPFSARVVKGEGRTITLDAGLNSMLSAGDVLKAYRIDQGQIQEYGSARQLGVRETPLATVVVRQVQPLFSLAELEEGGLSARPGDIVRVMPERTEK